MATDYIIWPSSLPAPSLNQSQPAERRRVSSISDGMPQFAGRQRDFSGEETVEWEFTAAQAAAFDTFYTTRLTHGGAWFTATWPTAHVEALSTRKFKGRPKWTLIGHEYWKVSAVLYSRGRSVQPGIVSNAGLVAAFDFGSGYVDLANTGRTIGVQGSFTADTVHTVNGSQSALLGPSSYFWLPVSADFGFGTGDFGIDLWSYYANPPGGQSIDLVALNGVFNLYDNGSSQLQNQVTSGSAGNWSPITAANVWRHHFFGRRAGVMYFGLNGSMGTGIPQGNGPGTNTTTDVGSTGYIVFGNRNPSSSTLFSGAWSVDRIRVYKGVCPYVADYIPETGSYPA